MTVILAIRSFWLSVTTWMRNATLALVEPMFVKIFANCHKVSTLSLELLVVSLT
jgi:hypothetical protein